MSSVAECAPGTVVCVRCPSCLSSDDKVVDSRVAEEGTAIRRRRECLLCGRRFTTFERLEERPAWVMKRSGRKELFDRRKVIAGVAAACKNRPVSTEAIEELAFGVEESVRAAAVDMTSERLGREILERLKELDEVAYMRFASVYKGFEHAGDFEREIGLLTKSSPPKAPSPH